MTESKSVALPLGYTPTDDDYYWWGETDSNRRTQREQIYSLPRLATSLSPRKNGAGDRNRTHNPLITSQVLYQLSYTGAFKLFNNGGSGRNRTADTRIFSPLLYRLSYRANSLFSSPFKKNGGADGTRTRDLRCDRPA